MKTLTTVEEFDAFISNGDNVKIIDFYAEWCQPCQRFLKIADRVEEALAPLGAEIAKVDCEKSPELAKRFEITKFPTFLYAKNTVPQLVYYGIRPIAAMQEAVNHILDNPI